MIIATATDKDTGENIDTDNDVNTDTSERDIKRERM